jgi:dUTP pyrophosphatase
MQNIAFKVLDGASKATHAWFDGSRSLPIPLFASLHQPSVLLGPKERIAIQTGVIAVLPDGIEAQVVAPKSWGVDTSLMILNSPGTIDPDYRGEIKVLVMNFGSEMTKISQGELIAELRLAKFVRAEFTMVDSFEDTDRSASGLGSTGVE